jgi:DNA-directed RNA polymerase II subunit RPB2
LTVRLDTANLLGRSYKSMSAGVGWRILDAYFKDTRYPRARFALDGYDEFILQGVARLIMDMNPFSVSLTGSNEKVDLFIGGRRGDSFQLVHPKLDTGHDMLPNHARLYDLSYSATLVATVAVADGAEDTILEGVVLGEIPIMLHSCVCRLHGLSDDRLVALGECPYDEGGYFIVDGKEKFLPAEERAVKDRPWATRTPADPVHDWRCRLNTLEVSRVRKTGELRALGLPLFILFRLVGLETDSSIMQAIRTDAVQQDTLDDGVRPSVLQASSIGYTFAAAFKYAARVLGIRKADVVRLVRLNLPVADKPGYLASVTAELLRAIHGTDPVTDEGSLVNKRVDTSGVRFGRMLCDHYAALRDSVKSGSHGTVADLLTSDSITEGMRRGLKHELPRHTMHGAMSCLSMVETTAPSLHGSHWGVICPVEARLGISKQFALLARATTELCKDSVVAALIDLGTVPGATIGTPVSLNGTLVGTVTHPRAFTIAVRTLRRNGYLHGDLSIAWRPGSAQVEVACDAGRLTRPLLIAGAEVPTNGSWAELLPTVRGNTYVRAPIELGHGAPIEYVDCAEAGDTYVAMSPEAVTEHHTHCEIHPSTIMSPLPLLTPFLHHNLAEHNSAACEHVRSCASLYSTSFNSRADACSHLMDACERPMVETRYGSYFGTDTLAYGCNAIVAIAALSGYNTGAAILMNASSVERGLCHTTHFRTLVFDEGEDGHFCNPVGRLAELQKGVAYDSLNADGLPVIGARVEPWVAIVGRIVGGRGFPEQDASFVADGALRGVVDRVLVYPHPSGQGRRIKVRVRQERTPSVGDAFAARHGRRTVVAQLVRQEDMPFLADGTVPDIVVNPSHVTVAGLMEAMGAKAGCYDGAFVDATPLTGEDRHQEFGLRLEAVGKDRHGAEIMYNPARGDQMSDPISMCPTYCMRLYEMAVDKLMATLVGRVDLTGQPVRGARIGEPERDTLLASGSASFLKESMTERSDGTVSAFVDGDLQARHAEFGTVPLPHDVHSPETAVHKVPRALTVLQQELACTGVRMAVRRQGRDPQYGDSAE